MSAVLLVFDLHDPKENFNSLKGSSVFNPFHLIAIFISFLYFQTTVALAPPELIYIWKEPA